MPIRPTSSTGLMNGSSVKICSMLISRLKKSQNTSWQNLAASKGCATSSSADTAILLIPGITTPAGAGIVKELVRIMIPLIILYRSLFLRQFLVSGNIVRLRGPQHIQPYRDVPPHIGLSYSSLS